MARFVGACPVCDGVWIDHEPGRSDVDVALPDSSVVRHACPRGHGPMRAARVPALRDVALELCPVCRGLWLTGAARRAILRETGSEARRRRLELAGRGLVWVAQILTRMRVEPGNLPEAAPWRLYGVAGTLVIVYVASVLGLVYARDYALRPGAIIDDPGNLYTLLTHIFFHADWLHLLGNLYFFYLFGRSVEHVFAGGRFLVVFFSAGVIGGLAQALLAPASSTLVLGASGAIAGIMGAHLWIYPRVRVLQVIPFLYIQIELPVWAYLGLWLGCQVVMAASVYTLGMAWYGHIAGFLYGLAAAVLQLPRRRRTVAARVRDAVSGH